MGSGVENAIWKGIGDKRMMKFYQGRKQLLECSATKQIASAKKIDY